MPLRRGQRSRMMQTGWRAQAGTRRPSHTARLRRKKAKPNISRRRRTSVKNSNAALRRKGLL